MRLSFLLICFLLFSYSILAHEPTSTAFRFIENKNQWDKKILYKTDIPSGALFLEKNCLTYHLIDGLFLSSLHNHKDSARLDTSKIRGHAFKVNFENSNQDVVVNAEDNFEDYYNYFLGKDAAKWASKAQAFKIVNYQNLYEGIDLKVYTYNNQLKYDFIILPNVDPSLIRVRYDGLENMSLSEGGLVLQTSLGNVVEQRPYAYQRINGKVIPVPCHYVLEGNKLSYAFPKGYNKNQQLIIDPTLIFSTYSGSFADNFGYTATFDSDGFLYSGSTAFGIGYPVTTGAYQTTFRGGQGLYTPPIGVDLAITKYDTTGTKRIYSTYLGGEGDEMPHSMIVNSRDELYIFGTTGSASFPITPGAYDNTFAGGTNAQLWGLGIWYAQGSDIFVSKLSTNGSSLLASTYIGGSANDGLNLSSSLRYNYADEARGEIDIDKNDNVYVVTSTMSPDFPIVESTFQQTFGGGIMDGCIVKLESDLSRILWSSFVGGESSDAAYSLAIDDSSNVYIAGGTLSTLFPVSAGVLYPSFQGGRSDGFITHVTQDGLQVLSSTYFGSSTYDQVYFVELDIFSNVHVFGQTTFTGAANPFIHNSLFNQPNSGQFISKMTPELDSLVWSTVFGNGSGRPNISPTAFLVDLCSKIYLSGWGGTPENTDFLWGVSHPFDMLTTLGPNPVTDFYQPTTTGKDFYLLVLEDDASSVHYASFFGGNQSAEHVDGGTSRFDRKGKIYQAMCAGCGGNSDMPVKPPYGSTELPAHNNSGFCNLGVFKMDFRLPIVVADFTAEPGCAGDVIQFTNKSLTKSATTFQWNFGDGVTSTETNPVHTYPVGGEYDVRLIINDNATCNLGDTIIKRIYISNMPNVTVGAITDRDTIYKGQSTSLHAIPNAGYGYSWTPSGSLNNPQIPNPIAKPDTSTTYSLTISDLLLPQCSMSAAVRVHVIEINCEEPDIFIPNAFTPNGDNNNEVVFVRSNYIMDMYFTIYNRWGEKVFETRDQNIGWDGTFKGMKADPGVFVYYLEVTCIDEQKFFKKGNITLIR